MLLGLNIKNSQPGSNKKDSTVSGFTLLNPMSLLNAPQQNVPMKSALSSNDAFNENNFSAHFSAILQLMEIPALLVGSMVVLKLGKPFT